ncbi:hypothetical protein JYK02_37210 [Corallococcus macrosporus]|uniref:Uncharacterized protein n=1 Tax=Corallococcus macrosporus TaxID=35 RepID=A0ABS3DPH2_9BACT|nr:hypothetical protein [Corallococcus macrosporus]MBN8233168.1 hypothetical protein [Corallococcus macrosporus]
MSHLEQPEAVNAAISTFLDEMTGARSRWSEGLRNPSRSCLGLNLGRAQLSAEGADSDARGSSLTEDCGAMGARQ